MDLDADDPEGICLSPDGERLLVISEAGHSLSEYEPASGHRLRCVDIPALAAFDEVAPDFDADDTGDGFEGVASGDEVYLVKEQKPVLLLRLDAALERVLEGRELGPEQGFDDDGEDIDASGLCYDARRQLLWVLSDQARRVFLYDWSRDRCVANFPLTYEHKGKLKTVDKAEGVALDSDRDVLYVVSDSDARLYSFRITED